MEAKGKTILKVVGILLIIGGVMNLITGIIGSIGGGATIMMGSEVAGVTQEEAAIIGGILIAFFLSCIVYGAISLVVGIMGVKYCADVSKANKCFRAGIVLFIADTILILFGIMSGSGGITNLLGLTLPVLYLFGAHKNKVSAEQ